VALNYEPQVTVVRQQAAPPQRATDPAPEPKQLQRRAEWPAAEGTLQQIDCVGKTIRMRIAVGARTLTFAISDPGAVIIKNHGVMDFTCGPQKPRSIRVEYEPTSPGKPGVIRTIEFP